MSSRLPPLSTETSLADFGVRLAPLDALAQLNRESRTVRVVLQDREVADLYQLASGAYRPLSGFVGPDDHASIVADLRLRDGSIWPIPITIAVSDLMVHDLAPGKWLLLTDSQGHPHGRMLLDAWYRPDREAEVLQIYGTLDPTHPGVRSALRNGPVYLSGSVEIFQAPWLQHGLEWVPGRVNTVFKQRGWQRIVAFQTRNPIHRAHEYIQKSALESMDGLFVHPLVGPTKSDDIPPTVRIRTYHAILRRWYPKTRVFLGAYTGPMRYAGPREAMLHALVRRNYGATHFIVGRNHAGVGDFYGPYDAHHLLQRFTPDELGIQPLFYEDAFYCQQCASMASTKTCPHPSESHVTLSGSEIRSRLRSGYPIPPEFSRTEVTEILQAYYDEHERS